MGVEGKEEEEEGGGGGGQSDLISHRIKQVHVNY